jgi:hypothetical protein
MAITGFKIFWGTSLPVTGETMSVHPVNAAYNSPIDVTTLPGFDIGNPTAASLPSDFWVESFAATGIFIRVASYDGTALVGLSKVLKIKHYGKIFTGVGQFFPFCRPLDDGNLVTVKQTCNTLVSAGAFFKTSTGWKYVNAYSGLDDTPAMDGMTGVLFVKPDDEGVISWLGKPWRKEQ